MRLSSSLFEITGMLLPNGESMLDHAPRFARNPDPRVLVRARRRDEPMAQPNQLRPAGAGGPVKAASDTCRLSSAKRVRTLWLSDLHLGTTGCQAQHLLDFLEQYEAETIYLVGDIIDGWQLRRRWVWDPVQHRVLMHFIDAAGRGTRVIFVPGNHDEFARPFDGMVFAGIVVRREAVHKTVDGRRLLVVHGDQFDGIVGHARWLALLGDSLYTSALWLNRHFNRARASLGLGYWSLSQYLKHRVKNAVSFICDYERALVEEARRRGVDGVICGHIHKAELREFDGLTYANCGDWVESLTALVEWHDGRLSLLAWSDCAAVDAVADTRREQRAVEEVA